MASNNLRELAKQGDPKVISEIINHSLQKKGIKVQVARDNGCLEVTLQSNQLSNQQTALVEFIKTGIVKLGVESIHTIKVYGVQAGDETPLWEEEILLGTPQANLMPEMEEISEDEDFPEPLDELDQEVEADYETETDEDYDEEEEYDEELDDNEGEGEEEESPPQPQKKKTPLILAILLLIILVPVAALTALHFSGIYVLPFLSESKSEKTKPDTPDSSTSTASPPDSQASVSPKPTKSPTTTVSNPWYLAVKTAESAAKKAQTAKTQSEWNAVATDWQKAVDLMKEVPQSEPNYQKAQEKIPEYQKNVDIAKQRSAQAPN